LQWLFDENDEHLLYVSGIGEKKSPGRPDRLFGQLLRKN